MSLSEPGLSIRLAWTGISNCVTSHKNLKSSDENQTGDSIPQLNEGETEAKTSTPLSHMFTVVVGSGVVWGGQRWWGPSLLVAHHTLTSSAPVLLRCGQQASTSHTVTSWP